LGFPLSAWAGVKHKVLHNFGAGKDGDGPFGPLILDSKGNLYGVTGGGGTGCGDYGCGTVYKLSPRTNGTWKEAVLFNFPVAAPWGGLVIDSSGNIYGTMQDFDSGVFELSDGSNGWHDTMLYTDGAGPGLLMDDVGNLYGEMGPGQYKYYGAMGELSPGSNGWNYTELYSFCSTFCPDGFNPPAPPSGTARATCLALPPRAASATHNASQRPTVAALSTR
jgi:uncharacterized repeat protein (TIGR03803 family)